MRRLFSAATAGVFVSACVLTTTVAVIGQAKATPRTAAKTAAAKALKNPVPVSPVSIEAGSRLFDKNCSVCHGAGGKGDGPLAKGDRHPANLVDAKWDHGNTDGEIFTTIHDGVAPDFDMDTWEGTISDPDIWNIVNFIRSLAPKPAK